MVDLPAAHRSQVFRLIDSVQPEGRYKTLVVDRRVKEILAYSVETHELLDRQVANVLLLDSPRQTETYLDAIYICECNEYTIGCVSADFIRRPPRYKRAHVFFLPGGNSKLITQFKNSTISHYLSHVGEAPLGWLPMERAVFSMGEPWAFDRLYNENCHDQVPYLDIIAQKIASVCMSLQEFPYIRYWWPHAAQEGAPQRQFPMMLATAIQSHLHKMRNQYMTPELDAQSKTTLLVVDRTLDLWAPLMHEFTFQALAVDACNFKGNKYKSKNGSVEGELNESDLDWCDLRHQHISIVTQKLTDRIKALREANPHLADNNKDVTVHDVRNMMAALPEFVKSRDNVSVNLQVALECMETVDNSYLREVAEFEQNAALGKHGQGTLADDLVRVLALKGISRENKLRAIIVYVLARNSGLFRADYERLARHTGLKESDLEQIWNLASLGVSVLKAVAKPHKGKKETNYVRENNEQELLYTRYEPALKTVVEQLLQNKLSRDDFPFCGEEPLDEEAGTAEAPVSLRNPKQRATWALNTTAGNAKQHGQRRKLIVIVLGGFTASESRSMYELTSKYPKDVVIGGEDLLTPQSFLKFLERQKLPREELKLPVDAPSKKVPDFLMASDRENRNNKPIQKNPASPPPVTTTSTSKSDTVSQTPVDFIKSPDMATPHKKGMGKRLKNAFRTKKKD